MDAFDFSSPAPGTCIGTTWLSGNRVLESESPIDASVIGSVLQTTDAELETVIAESARAFHQWRMVPAPRRGEFVRRLGNELRKHKDALGTLVSREMGKSKQEGDGEVQEMIDMADFAVGQSRMLYGKTMHSERPEHRMYEQWHPLGIVAVLTAFNFPVAVWAWNAFIAAICGNVVIWKPSPKTPLCAIAVQRICAEVIRDMRLPDVFSLVVTDQVPLAEKLVDDARIPLVSFTGSTAVGRVIGRRVADRFGRSLLELSGNNAAILTESTDLKLAIPACVFGAVGTAGQRCTTLRRLLVHESIYDQTLGELVKAYRQLKIGDPTDARNHVGPVIDAGAVTAFHDAVIAIRTMNGRIACGGNVLPMPGYYVEPTIVEAQPDWELVHKETFVPILYVLRYRTLDDAIAMNNEVDHGLSSAIFTTDVRQMETFLSACGSDCGIANVNIGTSGAEIGGAFGGEKHTGGGREAGSDAWKAYMRRQTNTINWGTRLPLAQGIQFNIGDPS